jgi:N-acetylglutamate synthase/N-acetylornithine aminotransferase
MEVTCRGAADEAAANAVARSIAGSSLVKAAVYGHDPNWGRIACAAGCARAAQLLLHILTCSWHNVHTCLSCAVRKARRTLCSDHVCVLNSVSV